MVNTQFHLFRSLAPMLQKCSSYSGHCIFAQIHSIRRRKQLSHLRSRAYSTSLAPIDSVLPSYNVNNQLIISPLLIQYPDIYQIKRERFGRALERFKQLYEAPIVDAYYQMFLSKRNEERVLKNREKRKVNKILRKIKKAAIEESITSDHTNNTPILFLLFFFLIINFFLLLFSSPLFTIRILQNKSKKICVFMIGETS
jgi:hypothetical protein